MGLVSWCIKGPLVCYSADSAGETTVCKHSTKIASLLSKLHLSILQSLQAYKSMELNQELFSIPAFGHLAKSLVYISSRMKTSGSADDLNELLHMCIDRLGQVIQVARVTGSLRVDASK
jgi:hypothetical protein